MSPPKLVSSASASTSATIASPTTAARGRIATSLRSMCARPGWPVARSTASSGLRSVATGLTAARTTTGAPLDMPPSMPPARLVRRPQLGSSGSTSSCTWLPRRSMAPNPSPISTPLTAWMPITAAASAASSRVSHSALEPSPMGSPSATTTKLPPIESPSSIARSTSARMRSSASGSGQRRGDGSRRSRSAQPSGTRAAGSSTPPNARTGPSWSTKLQMRTPATASSWAQTEPAATRGAVERAEARSSTSRMSPVSYLMAPARSACPGRASVTGFGRAPRPPAPRTCAPASSPSPGSGS